MRFEYELTRAEFDELILVGASGPGDPRVKRSVRPSIAYSVIVVCLAIALATISFRRSSANGWTTLLDLFARSEWILPWFIALALRFIPIAYGKGLAVVRTVWIACFASMAVLIAMVLLANRYGEVSSLLSNTDIMLRAFPWFVNAVTLWAFFRLAWPLGRFESHFRASWFHERRFVVTISDTSIEVETDQFAITYKWSALASLKASRQLLNVFDIKRNVVIVIPVRAIGDATDIQKVREIIESRVSTSERGFEVTTKVSG